VIAGVHRYLIDIDGVTAIPCFITSIVAGLLSGLINRKVPKAQRWKIGILAGMLCETLTMILVVVWAPSFSLGLDIVSKIGIPMILGSVCIGFIVLLVQSVEGKRRPAPRAGKTGARYRQQNAAAVPSRQQRIPAPGVRHYPPRYQRRGGHHQYRSRAGLRRVGESNYHDNDDDISPTTRQAIEWKIIIKNNDEAHRTPEIHSMLVIPLWEKGVVTGTLKIYYCHAHRITSSLQEMAVGLSQIISTQLEVSRRTAA
jgi:two-component system LytT family sensor kinase